MFFLIDLSLSLFFLSMCIPSHFCNVSFSISSARACSWSSSLCRSVFGFCGRCFVSSLLPVLFLLVLFIPILLLSPFSRPPSLSSSSFFPLFHVFISASPCPLLFFICIIHSFCFLHPFLDFIARAWCCMLFSSSMPFPPLCSTVLCGVFISVCSSE